MPVARDVHVEDAKRMIASKKRRLALNPANARYRFARARSMCMVPEPLDASRGVCAESMKSPRRARHPGLTENGRIVLGGGRFTDPERDS